MKTDRVLVRQGGSLRAEPGRGGPVPDVVFLRGDGWTLGAPAELAEDAYRSWAEEWTHFSVRGSGWVPIERWSEDALSDAFSREVPETGTRRLREKPYNVLQSGGSLTVVINAGYAERHGLSQGSPLYEYEDAGGRLVLSPWPLGEE